MSVRAWPQLLQSTEEIILRAAADPRSVPVADRATVIRTLCELEIQLVAQEAQEARRRGLIVTAPVPVIPMAILLMLDQLEYIAAQVDPARLAEQTARQTPPKRSRPG